MTTTRGLGEFQCSSASRKFLNGDGTHHRRAAGAWFQCSSASRKFLNVAEDDRQRRLHLFQCSSASRKFLNRSPQPHRLRRECRFSALQRAENSSISTSPPPAPQAPAVSVLFSEPKIPQYPARSSPSAPSSCFSALQRAENSSIRRERQNLRTRVRVSVLFSEPKIPQCRPSHLRPSIFPTAMITLRHS